MEREFKDSGIEWIGRIPKEWKINKVNRLFRLIGSGTTPNSSDDDAYIGTINWLQSGDINGSVITYANKRISKETLTKYSALSVYEAPFIVVAMYGASVGNISISHINACVNQACCVMSESNIHFCYAFYTIKSAQRYLIYRAVGGGQPNISQNTLRQLTIPEPPLHEQQRIADYLDKKCGEIDELIALQEQMITQLTDYKQSVITEAVTKGLNPEAELVPSGIDYIGNIPKNWNGCAPMKRFTEIILGKMLQSSASNDDTLEQYICAKDVHFDGVDYSDLKSMYFSNYEKKQYEVHKGDMLVVEGGAGAAGSAIVERDIHNVYIQNSIMIVRPHNDFCIKYARYVLFSMVSRGYVDYICNKATIPHFTKEKLSGTIIPIPPVSEQQSIAAYLDTKCSEIDSLIAIKQQKIETLKDYKKSVIYEAVTGKMTIGETP